MDQSKIEAIQLNLEKKLLQFKGQVQNVEKELFNLRFLLQKYPCVYHELHPILMRFVEIYAFIEAGQHQFEVLKKQSVEVSEELEKEVNKLCKKIKKLKFDLMFKQIKKVLNMEYFELNVKFLFDSVRLMEDSENYEVAQEKINSVNKLLGEMENFITLNQLNRQQSQKYQTCIVHLVCVKNKLFGFLQKIGGSLQEAEKNLVRWDNVSSAFQGRVTSGVITNLGQ